MSRSFLLSFGASWQRFQEIFCWAFFSVDEAIQRLHWYQWRLCRVKSPCTKWRCLIPVVAEVSNDYLVPLYVV
jgi:hypothetical protein